MCHTSLPYVTCRENMGHISLPLATVIESLFHFTQLCVEHTVLLHGCTHSDSSIALFTQEEALIDTIQEAIVVMAIARSTTTWHF